MSRNPKRARTVVIVLLTLLILAMIAATAYVIWLCIDMVNRETDLAPSSDTVIVLPTATKTEQLETLPPETTVPETQPQPEHVVSTATISTQGDMLMHIYILETCKKADGTYDFSSILQYLKDYTTSYDYAIANLETTFGGDEHPYQGNPRFNTPDSFADSLKDAGFDLMLTANNHTVDTNNPGVIRTVEQLRQRDLVALGTSASGDEPKYTIVEVNGIKIGMICYTCGYARPTAEGMFSLNGLTPIPDEGLVNYFMKGKPEKLYTEVEQHMADMKADGAEATMMFIHWGEEYQLTPNAEQKAIAQKLCDMGFDVIIGGHPHVLQPMALLESTVDPDHKTVCLYSTGNAVSNQRSGMSEKFPKGYTEDGIMFNVTFEKYSDGTVYLAGADVVPTWVNMHFNNGPKEYNILPLDIEKQDQWTTMFDLETHQFNYCQQSYKRTMKVVGDGLETCQTYLQQAKLDREAYYLDLLENPEKYATEAAQTSDTTDPTGQPTG